MTVWQSSGRQNYHIAFLNIHGSPGQFLSAFCPQISSKLILTAAESQSSPPFVCIVLSYCCISSITIPLFFGAWLLPVACCTWARRVLPFWWDLTRLLLLLLSSGWWRRYINKLVGTKEARVPCTSGNTQCHSSVRWTSMYSFLVSQITIFIPIFCSQIVFLNCCSEQLEMAFLILNLVIHLLYTPSLFCSMTHLQNIVRRRLQSGKMNTKPGADRWSSHLSVSILLQMVNCAIFCFHYIFPISFPFSWFTFVTPMTANGFTPIVLLFNPSTTMQ